VRSAVQVDSALLANAGKLRVIGRAGLEWVWIISSSSRRPARASRS
jgi:hypothetical protein